MQMVVFGSNDVSSGGLHPSKVDVSFKVPHTDSMLEVLSTLPSTAHANGIADSPLWHAGLQRWFRESRAFNESNFTSAEWTQATWLEYDMKLHDGAPASAAAIHPIPSIFLEHSVLPTVAESLGVDVIEKYTATFRRTMPKGLADKLRKVIRSAKNYGANLWLLAVMSGRDGHDGEVVEEVRLCIQFRPLPKLSISPLDNMAAYLKDNGWRGNMKSFMHLKRLLPLDGGRHEISGLTLQINVREGDGLELPVGIEIPIASFTSCSALLSQIDRLHTEGGMSAEWWLAAKKLVCENDPRDEHFGEDTGICCSKDVAVPSTAEGKGEMGESEECPAAAAAIARIGLSHAKVALSASNEEIIKVYAGTYL